MSWLTIIAVSLGGALGALCRSKATGLLKPHFTGAFPVPTLLINICSCTIAGVFLCLQMRMNHTAYLAATMGFLGGFSTLSTMNYEAVDLVVNGHAPTGIAYLAATYASTLGAAAAGFAMTALLVG